MKMETALKWRYLGGGLHDFASPGEADQGAAEEAQIANRNGRDYDW